MIRVKDQTVPATRRFSGRPLLTIVACALLAPAGGLAGEELPWSRPAFKSAAAEASRSLVAMHGEQEKVRIEKGIDQVLRLWRLSDGTPEEFSAFVRDEFIPRGDRLDATFGRMEWAFERLGGYFTSMVRDLRRGVDLEIGPLLPVDRRLGAYSPGAHLSDDLFDNKIAFVVLLNFPQSSLEERLAKGEVWSRRQWAESRLAQQFDTRIPADVNQKLSSAYSVADSYINNYNIYTHHLLTPGGKRLFPEGQRLISHWNLRDELKARYADPDGLPAQKMIALVMEKIVKQEIPAAVVNNPLLDWTPETGAVSVSGVKDADPPEGSRADPDRAREADTRYRMWMGIFNAERLADAYSPDNPTHIDRRFNVNREIPEASVKALLESVLEAGVGARVGKLIEKRLGRRLEPFDIWYVGFKARGRYKEEELNAATRKRYPDAAAYAADIPRLLRELGFSGDKSRFLADHIVVEPSRGAGHAFGAARRDDKAHLRTRVNEDGMDYKGYNIAVHEMGHNVEQVFSVTSIDHTLLQGVPNTAFTEALAMLFQSHDMELLGLSSPGADSEHLRALEELWGTREIGAVALVDMAAWRWLYDHPEATPSEFRAAVVQAAKDVWNRFFAEIFGVRDVALLAIYSHMVDGGMYTPDYPLGHMIGFQIEQHFKQLDGPMGPEFERICKLGSITPDLWMRKAVGSPLSSGPLIEAAERAVEALD